MKSVPSALLTHIRGERVTLAICWSVTKSTGGVLRGTEHDRDVTIASGTHAGTYVSLAGISGTDLKSSSDLSVDNMEVHGAETDSPSEGITWEEIDAGVLNGARVTVFVCNWQRPDDGQIILKRGFMGEVTRDSDFKLQTEIRGLAQVLQQQIGRVLSDSCDVVEFGDSRCKFDTSAITATGTVTVAGQRSFSMEFGSPEPTWEFLPAGGKVTFVTGENAGFSKEVKSSTFAYGVLVVDLYEEMSGEVMVGDDVEFVPGCDKTYSTCKRYGNLVNFRGWGVFVPGALKMMSGASVVTDCVVTLPDGTTSEDSP